MHGAILGSVIVRKRCALKRWVAGKYKGFFYPSSVSAAPEPIVASMIVNYHRRWHANRPMEEVAVGESHNRHRVVVIGSGFGGLSAVRALRRLDADVVLIDRTTHHLFQPLLYQVATGTLAEGDIAPATRVVLRNQQNATVLLGEVTDVDLANRTVSVQHRDGRREYPYDSLVVSAGSRQSYFGKEHFAAHAPGMKTVDDALELRGRILGAFDLAEVCEDSYQRARLLTFVVVGAGPTGVEMAGQIAELAQRTLRGTFRNFDPSSARVVLVDAADQVLPSFGKRLGDRARARLERVGVEVHLSAAVENVTSRGVTIRTAADATEVIEAACTVWSAGVAASPLGALLAEQSGAAVDRAGRICVMPDLTVPGHPEVFVVGDMASLNGLPGVAQVAIQGGRHAARSIEARLRAERDGAAAPQPSSFRYLDRGSMATVSRHFAVARVGRIDISGRFAWWLWLAVHLLYLVGHRNRFAAVIAWAGTFLSRGRGQMTITRQQVEARTGLTELRIARRELRRLRSAEPGPGNSSDISGRERVS